MDPNVFETANAGFAQVMYEEFLRDPASVDAEWRLLFESGVIGETPSRNGSDKREKAEAMAPEAPGALAPAAPGAGQPGVRGLHQGPGCTTGAEHEREPHGPDGDDLP